MGPVDAICRVCGKPFRWFAVSVMKCLDCRQLNPNSVVEEAERIIRGE